MFLEEFHSYHREELFEKGCPLTLCRLSHSFQDPNWSYHYHLHSNETELVYIAGGTGTLSINASTYRLKKGSLLVVERGSIHSLTSDQSEPLDCWTCAITGFKLKALPEEGFFLPPDVCPATEAGEWLELIDNLFRELDYIRQFQSGLCYTICDQMAAALACVFYERYYTSPRPEPQKNAYFLRDILNYLNENYTKTITLGKLSERFHISADHISHVFRSVYGVSPIHYLIARRMNEAAWLLIHTDLDVVVISQQVGYENVYHFSKLFGKYKGCAPLAFREKYKNRWHQMER